MQNLYSSKFNKFFAVPLLTFTNNTNNTRSNTIIPKLTRSIQFSLLKAVNCTSTLKQYFVTALRDWSFDCTSWHSSAVSIFKLIILLQSSTITISLMHSIPAKPTWTNYREHLFCKLHLKTSLLSQPS